MFGGVPLIFAYWRRVPWQTSFQLRWPRVASWFAAAFLGVSLWPLAHEITIATQAIGLVSLEPEQFARAKELIEQCRKVPVWLVVMAFALAPALFEEFCFRGFVLGGLRTQLRPWPAILFSGLLFGAFHLVATDALAVERLVPSTLLGIVLGWVCFRTHSLFPGIVLHALHNGLLSLLLYYLPELQARGWGVELLLIDWDLLPNSPIAALDELRSACPAALVIVLISHLDARQQAALSAGADAFIIKVRRPSMWQSVYAPLPQALGLDDARWLNEMLENRLKLEHLVSNKESGESD